MNPYLGTCHWLSLSFQLVFILIGLSYGQELNDDPINFRDLDVDWSAYPTCVANCFLRCSVDSPCRNTITSGCATNKCLCSTKIWKDAQRKAGSCGFGCSFNLVDSEIAEELFIQYCQMKGYERVYATSRSTTEVPADKTDTSSNAETSTGTDKGGKKFSDPEIAGIVIGISAAAVAPAS
ncbi:hypothetical protein BDZ91DRAFT_835672 [Kalaharituber pfeilii]|nr:hypothetical protein BDZ91DRAFT_835672 [Kalaharituber pfeilii]